MTDIDVNKEFSMHNDVLSRFNTELYKDILSEENISSKKIVVTLDGEKYYGYYLEKGKEKYFCPPEIIEKLPFKVTKSEERDFKGEVFKYIKSVASIKIPAEKRMTFRELVDTIPYFSHSNPTQWTLYKIISYTAYCDRINARISTEAGFGKDSLVNIFIQLVNSTKNIYGATFAKLEYNLTNKLLIFNEMGNLKDDDKSNMQEFLLAIGAYYNDYLKRTRKTSTTQEEYDISKVSLLIFYNLPEYYTSKNQQYFDQMFTKAVCNRFIPFHFSGVLTTKFGKVFDIDEVLNANRQLCKDAIATINWYKNNNVKDIKYKVGDYFTFTKENERYARTFTTILKYVAEYSETQEEFDELSNMLYTCYQNYSELIVKTRE